RRALRDGSGVPGLARQPVGPGANEGKGQRMKRASIVRSLCTLGVAIFFIAGTARAAEVRVLISAGLYGVYAELAPAFERASGHKLTTTRGPSMGDSPEAIPTRLARGEAADVVIMDGHGAEALVTKGVARDTVTLAISQVGMVVREGAPKPDIGTPEAFKKTLLEARSIAF